VDAELPSFSLTTMTIIGTTTAMTTTRRHRRTAATITDR
jgi:hypothetical protein